MTSKHFIASKHAVIAAAVLAFGLAAAPAFADDNKLSGGEEVPPVQTSATGENMLKIGADGMVTGMIMTKGIEATMAHIHMAAKGANGPVIVPLKKGANAGEWVPAEGAKLTDEQMKAYKAGNLYANVHSEAHKGGEIRDQMEP